MRHDGLGNPEDRGEIAHAELFPRQRIRNPEASGIAEQPERLRQSQHGLRRSHRLPGPPDLPFVDATSLAQIPLGCAGLSNACLGTLDLGNSSSCMHVRKFICSGDPRNATVAPGGRRRTGLVTEALFALSYSGMRAFPIFIRRCTTLVLILTLGLLFSVELQIADVHDGHADSAVSELVPRDVDGSAPATPTPGHTVHVDHCAHSHASLIAATDAPADPPHEHFVVPGMLARAPAGPAFAPPVRPPLA